MLRVINYNHWLYPTKPPWLIDLEKTKDLENTIHDIKPTNGRLSVWEIKKNRSNLNRIIAAFSARRNNIQKFEYIIIEDGLLKNLGIKRVRSEGDTADNDANSNWHYNITGLTLKKVIKLSCRLWRKAQKGSQIANTILAPDVFNFIVEEVRNGHLDLDKTSLREKDKIKVKEKLKEI